MISTSISQHSKLKNTAFYSTILTGFVMGVHWRVFSDAKYFYPWSFYNDDTPEMLSDSSWSFHALMSLVLARLLHFGIFSVPLNTGPSRLVTLQDLWPVVSTYIPWRTTRSAAARSLNYEMWIDWWEIWRISMTREQWKMLMKTPEFNGWLNYWWKVTFFSKLFSKHSFLLSIICRWKSASHDGLFKCFLQNDIAIGAIRIRQALRTGDLDKIYPCFFIEG